ncbi:MAG TPA: discoidin domain-containing protein [Bryobacteraceae bacterium]|nr:discoidin domain-containing protein [Bryobacteraceae bacterium]
MNALAPEASPDGSGYHMGNVARMWRRHGFVWDYQSMYSYLSQGMEMLFLVAYSIGRHASAALVHFAFLITLALLLVCYGRRFGFPRAGLFAAVLVLASPVVGRAGSSAYNDLGLAALLFGVFYLLQIWDEEKQPNLLILIGLLSGFGYGVKYTAVLGLAYTTGFVWWRAAKGERGRNLAILAAAAAVGILPWIARNWIWVGNPFAPFANRWFPNPYVHPGMEAMYLADLRHYEGIAHWWDVPRELLWHGRVTGGFVGPVFALAPISLLALRRPAGRQLLLAGLVFGIPAYLNTGARFLVPVLPFVSLALGMVLECVPWALVSLGFMAGIAAWPGMMSRYADRTAWRITGVPVAAALRIQPTAKYLNEHLKDYSLKAFIERVTPPRARIFSLASVAEAYVDRTFILGYESALGNFATDVLAAPLDNRYLPRERQRFRLLPVATRAVRVLQTGDGAGFWSINEMHVGREGNELARSGGWRVKAWPNGWDAPLAFDNSYATRWSSWQQMGYGMYLALDFGKTQVIDEVWLDEATQPGSKVQVEVLDARGRWIPLTDSCETEPLDTPGGLRRAATLALKAKGIRYLLVRNTDFFANDMRENAAFWGVTELHRSESASLYLIQ